MASSLYILIHTGICLFQLVPGGRLGNDILDISAENTCGLYALYHFFLKKISNSVPIVTGMEIAAFSKVIILLLSVLVSAWTIVFQLKTIYINQRVWNLECIVLINYNSSDYAFGGG